MERVAQPLAENFLEKKVKIAGRVDCPISACSWALSDTTLELRPDLDPNARRYVGDGGSLVREDFMGDGAEEVAVHALGVAHELILAELKSQAAISATCRELRLRVGPTRPTLELALVRWRTEGLQYFLAKEDTPDEEFGEMYLRVYGMEPQQEHLALFDADYQDELEFEFLQRQRLLEV
jgi:hypothetical protein